jgi:purine-binding chemotaxis protein CheW
MGLTGNEFMSISLSEVPNGSQASPETQWVVFCIAGSEMSVSIRQVREIIRLAEITMMPRAPKFLKGIINLRGRIIPVLDLKRRFNMPLVDPTSESRILVVEIGDQMLGLLVDKVLEVLKAPASVGTPPEKTILNIGPEFIKEIWISNSRQILYLDLRKLFVLEEIKLLSEQVSSSRGGGKASGY